MDDVFKEALLGPANDDRWTQFIYATRILYTPGSPAKSPTPEQLARERSWRLVCHTCGHKWPRATAINVNKADCCTSPNIHIHS